MHVGQGALRTTLQRRAMNFGSFPRRCVEPSLLVLALGGGAGCEPGRPAPGRAAVPAAPAAPLRAPTAIEATATASSESTSRTVPPEDRGDFERAEHFPVAVLEPTLLRRLERERFALGAIVLGVEASSTAELNRTPGFRSIFDELRRELERTRRVHPLARVTSVDGFRLFDASWLDSEQFSFELIGVFNRMDRRVYHEVGCGEIRFLYRLAYRVVQGGEPWRGRLPMTVNVVFRLEGDCAAHAASWRGGDGEAGGGTRALASAADLERFRSPGGPLHEQAIRGWTLLAVETNLQTVRLQSSVQTSLAGHIEYALHVFAPEAGSDRFRSAPLENTPDVERLEAQPELRSRLLEHLRQPESLRALDEGTLRLPEEFLATRATSVAPRGLTRPANRPFRRLFGPKDLEGLAVEGTRTISTAAAFLRRLDGMSCVGCHQSRALAGFHHVGFDALDQPTHDALLDGRSAHLRADLLRRQAYVAALALGRTPEEFRPVPERQGQGGGAGAPCGLSDPGFASWTCADGLRCVPLEDPEVGVCLGEMDLGSPCEYGQRVLPGNRSHRDLVAGNALVACGEGRACARNVSGFAWGSCTGACSDVDGACADFLDVDGFQACLRQGRPGSECARGAVFGLGVASCDVDTPCRQDYVCLRSPREHVGACVPPYFVYQLRLDGYPLKH